MWKFEEINGNFLKNLLRIFGEISKAVLEENFKEFLKEFIVNFGHPEHPEKLHKEYLGKFIKTVS